MTEKTPDPALSHTVGPADPPLLEQTIGDNLDATVARFPERDAVVDRAAGIRLTYAALGDQVDRLARALVGAGIEKGDRVGIWAPNRVEWTLTQYATAKVGAILVTINPAYRSHELAYVLNQAGVRMAVIAASFKSSDYVAMVEAARAGSPALEDVVVLGQGSWDALLARADEVSPERLTMVQAALDPGDPINIQYTSGTTGFPKGATLSHHNILNNGYLVGELCRYTEEDRICIPVPFYHCFGMVMGNLAAITHGACAVIPAPGFDPAATLDAVAEERCTSLYGVPTMFIAEWALPDLASRDLSSVRTGIMAGSPCPASVMTQLIEAGIEEMTICYGMTETSPVSTQTRTDDSFERKVGTVGAVHPHLEVKVVDPVTRETLPRGQTGELCRYTEEDRICIPVPFYHCFGMVMGNLAATTHGACAVIPAPGFDPAATLDAVAEEGCTSLYGVPTMFIAEWALPDLASRDLSSVRTGIMAGSPCPASVMTQLIEAGIAEMTICYGMTETSPVSTQTRTDDSFERKVGTVGAVHPHLEVKVVDPVTRETLPRGQTGELCTRGYSVMLGYWEEPEKTAEVLVDGWMHTGDLAVMDADGYVQITGRIKDMVIRGGENIYPREVEEFLYGHPDVLDAQVVGVPDSRYGEELCAWVRMREGAPPLTAESLREYAQGRLARYKIPRYVRVVDEFPMTVTGKVRKVEMREASVVALGLDGG